MGQGLISFLVKDSKMSGDRIYNGDTVLVDAGVIVKESDIAFVYVPLISEYHVRRFKKQNGSFYLKPSNPDVPIERYESIDVIGKVVKVVSSC